MIDFRGSLSTHLGNMPTLKLFQTLKKIEKYDLLLCCREEIQEIMNYMAMWKPYWVASKDLLRRLGWSMITSTKMGTNPMEIPNNHCSQMNILLWNCKGDLNGDFKRRVFEMAMNHFPSIMVITETRVAGDRAAKIIEAIVEVFVLASTK